MATRIDLNSAGVRLFAHLYLPNETAKSPAPAVVICPGLGSRKENHADFAEDLVNAGFAALALDLRGHGESAGELDDQVLTDLHTAIAYLKSRPEIDPARLALRGSSLGGLLVIHAAAQFAGPRAVVAICPAREERTIETFQDAGRPKLWQQEGLSVRFNPQGFLAFLRSHDVTQAVAQLSPKGLFLIHAKGDERIPYTLTQELFQGAGEPKRLLLIEGGSHTAAQHDPEVRQAVIVWLREMLG